MPTNIDFPPVVRVVAVATLVAIVIYVAVYWLRKKCAGRTRPTHLDENVQFTVYRPDVVRPQRWYPMLAFAHLSEKPPDAGDNEPDPLEEVTRQAKQVLDENLDQYSGLTQDSRQAVPHEGELTFVPEVPGIEFNPPRRSFRWQEAVHREEFRLRASSDLDGRMARGRLTVFHGAMLLADVPLQIRVDSRWCPAGPVPSMQTAAARPYRRIFASYSHKDAPVVEQCTRFAAILGDQYLRDCIDLRTGEVWSERLADLIREADVFQLFWSTNSMHSSFVQQEWVYALTLDRPNFIRPTYWEEPLPEDPAAGLPPDALRRLHFQRLVCVACGMVNRLKSTVPKQAEDNRRRGAAEQNKCMAIGWVAIAIGSLVSWLVSSGLLLPLLIMLIMMAALHLYYVMKSREAKQGAADPTHTDWQRRGDLMAERYGRLVAALRGKFQDCKQLAEADPTNTGCQRNLWVFCCRLAIVLEKQGDLEAGHWWRRAYEVLSAMKHKGFFISPQDEGFLQQLRRKVLEQD